MTLAAAADVATVVATTLAAAGLWITAWSSAYLAKTNDASTLMGILEQTKEAEDRLLAAPVDARLEKIYYLNLLETLAAAYNSNLFGKATRKIVKDRLVTDVSLFLAREPDRFSAEMTSLETFAELRQFHNVHREEIEQAVAIARARLSVQAAGEDHRAGSRE